MPLVALGMAFGSLLLIANIIAVKPFEVNTWVLPAGILAYPFTFLITDTISEVYGRQVATRIVWYGFALSATLVLFIYAAIALPPAAFWTDQAAYNSILGLVPRIFLGSMVAYLVSQHIDVVLFHFLRRITNRNHLWFRNNGSTAVSQAIDTVLFVSIAFGGSIPMPTLVNMMVAQYVVKLLIALFDTPLVYLLVHSIRSATERQANFAQGGEPLQASGNF